MYARYRTRSTFYTQKKRAGKAYNVNPNVMRKLNIKP